MKKIIDLSNCFPLGRDGTRAPLPKQRQFLEYALDKNSYKSIRYIGGVGSGKTLIGCTAVLHWAVLYPGDYLIARQFGPELKATTYRTFMDICPPELIAEVRIADMLVKIRSVNGGTSTIFFRGLEDPDKHRSMNLSGAYIDEANQVTEEAYMLLQGRLRGKGLRKIILTQNPSGHGWSWKWHVSKIHIADPRVKAQFVSVTAPSTENIHLPDGYIETMLSTWSEDRIKREVMGSEDSFQGMIYPEFDRATHVVKPFKIPENWTRRIGIDHGYVNEAAWIYLAVAPSGESYVYREYYQKGKLIEQICKENKALWGKDEVFEQARIDPSTKASRGQTGKSDYDLYLENLPSTFPLMSANNDVTSGINRCKSYLLKDHNQKPRVYIFDTCVNLLDELATYKWKELPPGQVGKVNEKEEPVKNHDHAMDAWRYVMVTCPEPTAPVKDPRDKLSPGSLERHLYDSIQGLKRPKYNGDPFGD